MYRSTGLVLLAALLVAKSSGNAIVPKDVEDVGKPVFNYLRNGIKVDVRVVPAANDTRVSDTDNFPVFPMKEIGHCLVDFSVSCAQKRIVRFLDLVGNLQEITLLGQSVKLVKLKELPEDRVGGSRLIASPGEMIDQSIDDFFEKFALRITFPRWKGKNNQIDLKFEDTDVVEGRGEKGGGGKGKKKGGKSKGGGGCKKMMMMAVVGMKAKLMGMIGMAAMKGMFMSGMSLMISKMMLISQYMKNKGGGGFFGGGGGCSSGGCGSSYSSPPQDSYAAPPVSSYSAPPQSSYGAPAPSFQPAPAPAPSSSYGAPAQNFPQSSYDRAPSSSYGAPAQNFPQSSYDRAPSSSYGAPAQNFPQSSYDRAPSSSYGAPGGGGGGGGQSGYDYSGGGGGSWGRSFDRRTMMEGQDSETMMSQDVEDLDVRPLTEDRWGQDATWSYSTEDAVSEQMKASQGIDKQETTTPTEQYYKTNSLRSIYAKSFKNYEPAKIKSVKYNSNYRVRQQ